jgi:hypothetical protein
MRIGLQILLPRLAAKSNWLLLSSALRNQSAYDVEVCHNGVDITKPSLIHSKGAARDFVMVPTVKQVQYLDDDGFDDLYLDDNDEWDEWEILGGPPLARSYAAAAHP